MTIYLYVKTHRITGLKYLGKTEQDPFKYKGSGKYWKRHLKEHGNDVDTIILHECKTDEEVSTLGLHYSKLWDIVNSKEWANLIDETGQGWSSMQAKQMSQNQLDNGTHPFLGGELQKEKQIMLVESGKHHLLKRNDGSSISSDRVKNGTHNFLGGEVHKKYQKEIQNTRIKNGTHNFLSKTTCEYCGKLLQVAAYSRWHGDNCKKK